jgi:DNA end-binding protein Ku
MKSKGKAAIGSVTMATRERPVLVKPRDLGLVAFTLRSPDEVRQAAGYFAGLEHQAVNAEMVALGAMIIEQKTGTFDPTLFEDAYQKSLRQIIEAKIGGTAPKLKPAAAQAGNVVDLMAALKRSLETGRSATPPAPTKKRAAAAAPPAAKVKKTARRKTG